MRNKQWKIPTKKQDKDKLYKQIQQKNNVKKERSQSKRNDEIISYYKSKELLLAHCSDTSWLHNLIY